MANFKSKRTPRVVTRGEKTAFRVAFFSDERQVIPITPLDPNLYPAYRIIDINGTIIQDGVGIADQSAGFWKTDFYVPKDANLSYNESRWRIEWVMLYDRNRQVTFVEEFDVRDVVITANNSRDLEYIVLENRPHRVTVRQTVRPYSLRLDVKSANDETTTLVDNATLQMGQIKEVQGTPFSGDGYVYYYDIPENLIKGCNRYIALWEIKETVTSAPDYEFQKILGVPWQLLQLFPSVRILIDRLQVKQGSPQAYEDSDIYESILQGGKMINSWHPYTNWQPISMPIQLEPFVIMGAGIWALQSQHLVETNLQFGFCLDKDTLLPTSKGLIRAINLIEKENLMKQAAGHLIVKEDENLLNLICNSFTGLTHIQDIINTLKLDVNSVSLGNHLALRYRLNKFRESDHAGGYVWDISKFKPYLIENYGMFREETQEGNYETKIEIGKPEGFKTPKTVWYLKNRQTFKVTNALGYPLIVSKEHPFLTLNVNTFDMEWKNLHLLREGDLIAINVKPEVEKNWKVDLRHYAEAVTRIKTPTSKEKYTFPEEMTPKFSRLLGYLTAEGCLTRYNRVIFNNTNKNILDDFNDCFKASFGTYPSYIGDTLGGFNEYPNGKTIKNYEGLGVSLRKFLSAIGIDYSKARNKKIPNIILEAPKCLAKEFLKGFFEGDGCFCKTETDEEIKFISSSEQLLIDIQNMLLRWGIVSKLKYDSSNVKEVGYVKIRGLSLVKYSSEIGFLWKGAEFEPKTKYYPQIESLDDSILFALKTNIRNLLNIDSKGWKDTGDGKKRFMIGWNHNFNYGTHITYKHVENWFNDVKDDVKENSEELYNKLKFFVDSKFLWKKVVKIEDAGIRDVVDPAFDGDDSLLSHAFISGGIITHNSGQTVTLDYEHTANIDAAIQRFLQYWTDHLTPAKVALVRASTPTGVVAGRPFRYNALHNFVFRMVTRSSNDMVSLLSKFGLL